MLRRLFARARTSAVAATITRKPAAHRFGLKLEALEGREVPATLTWIGTAATAAAFNDPASWISSDPQNNPTPQQGDDLIFRAPSAGGPVVIGGVTTATTDGAGTTSGGGSSTPPPPTGSNNDCLIPTAVYYNSIQLIAGYLGTVTVQDEQTVSTLHLETGAIAQAGSSSSGYDLNVLAHFFFTGGILNNTYDLGIVHLQGAAASIQPGSADAELGSTLSLEQRAGVGTTLTQLPGTLWTTNGAGFDIYAFCNYELPEQPGAQPVKIKKKQGVVQADGVINVYENGTERIDQPYEKDVAVWVRGGKLEVTHDGTVTGKIPGLTTTVALTEGAVYLKNGTTLTTPNFAMGGGVLYTLSTGAGAQVATINGNVSVAGGDVHLGQTVGQPHIWSELRVTDTFTMTGGTFTACVDGTVGSGLSDRITAKDMAFFTTAKAVANVLNPPQGSVSSRSWLVFESTNVIDDKTIATDAGWGVTFDNPVRKVYLRKN